MTFNILTKITNLTLQNVFKTNYHLYFLFLRSQTNCQTGVQKLETTGNSQGTD